MILLFLASAHIIITGPPPPGVPPANPDYIFSGYDYPAEAVQNRLHGTVVTELTIGPNGTPTACRIIKSSRYKVLDNKTCELLMRRAKFMPPKDKDGKPKDDIYRVPPITWELH